MPTERPRLQPPAREDWKQLLQWFVAHVIGGLLPLWGSFALVMLFGISTHLEDYVRQGEFALYASAMSGSALFLAFRDLEAPFPWRSLLGYSSVAILVFSTLIFAGVFVSTRLASPPQLPLDVVMLSWISIVLYLASLVAAIFLTLIDMLRSAFDPSEIPQQQLDQLREEFRGGSPHGE